MKKYTILTAAALLIFMSACEKLGINKADQSNQEIATDVFTPSSEDYKKLQIEMEQLVLRINAKDEQLQEYSTAIEELKNKLTAQEEELLSKASAVDNANNIRNVLGILLCASIVLNLFFLGVVAKLKKDKHIDKLHKDEKDKEKTASKAKADVNNMSNSTKIDKDTDKKHDDNKKEHDKVNENTIKSDSLQDDNKQSSKASAKPKPVKKQTIKKPAEKKEPAKKNENSTN